MVSRTDTARQTTLLAEITGPVLDPAWEITTSSSTRITFQPADRYWPFQFIELGIYTCLSAALIALTVRTVKRRLITASRTAQTQTGAIG